MRGNVVMVGPVIYAVTAPLLIKNRYPNQTQQVDQYIHKKRNQNYYNDMVETSSNQTPPQGYESMTRVPCRFYRQMTYDDQLQAYVFTNTTALLPAEDSMYIIFHKPKKKRNFRCNLEIRQFRQIKAENCDWTTRYLLCQDVIFNQMTDQANCVRQGRNKQMPGKRISDLWLQAADHVQTIQP